MENTTPDASADGGPASSAPDAAAPAPHPDAAALRASAARGVGRSIDDRLSLLADLERGLRAERPALLDALAADLGKSRTESAITELGVLTQEIAHTRSHLRRWLAPRKLSLGALLAPASGELWREPLGAVLIIAPWNYPLNLALSPLIGAIAGGNTTLVKPSEQAPATSAAIAHLVRTHLDPERVRVVEGGADETSALLRERFDLIFYTGGARVGRIVARAAAEHLTPTVLELGGKSPVIVDDDLDDAALAVAARRIMWGKGTNSGQTCVAPDHLLATAPTLDRLTPHLIRAARDLYGANPQDSPDYGRMISDAQFDRVLGLIDDGKAVLGGTGGADRHARFIPPTILAGASWDDPVMGEEIFGPVLPLLAVDGVDDAIERIRAGEKPLTAYVFTGSDDVERRVAAGTSSGSIARGFTLAHAGLPGVPFGGVGESGMGSYHGEAGLEAFTHAKPVVRKPLAPDTLRMVYPPYRGVRKGLLGRLFR